MWKDFIVHCLINKPPTQPMRDVYIINPLTYRLLLSKTFPYLGKHVSGKDWL